MAKQIIKENDEVQTPPQETARQKYERSFAEMNPGVDINDEEAYYGAKNGMLDELGRLRKNGANLRKAVDMENSPFGEMLLAAVEAGNGAKDFNPLKWYAKEKGADLKAILEDPEKADELMTAYNEGLEERAASDKEKDEAKQKQIDGLQAIYDADEANGISKEQTQQRIGEMFDKLDGIVKGDYISFYEMLHRDSSRDEDIERAREEGRKQGVSTKVNEKLRSMPEQQERNGGRQEKVPERKPKNEVRNPFLA